MNHVMIDLETGDTIETAKIVAIGAIVFNPDTGLRGEKFYSTVSIKSQPKRTTSKSTLDWWKKQSAKVRTQLKGNEDLEDVLTDFEWYLPENAIVWGNGASFDISILEHAYRQLGLDIPWKFYNIMDCRTIRRLYEAKRGGLEQNFNGTQHHALDDAIYQADYISKMWRSLKQGK